MSSEPTYNRLTDNDRSWWVFDWGSSDQYKTFSLNLNSRNEEDTGCSVTGSIGSFKFRIRIPCIIEPSLSPYGDRETKRYGFTFTDEWVIIDRGHRPVWVYLYPWKNFLRDDLKTQILGEGIAELIDYDGTPVTAEIQYTKEYFTRGGSWLTRAILPYFIVNRINVKYDKETGRRKMSWKGGTLELSAPVTDSSLTIYEATSQLMAEEDLIIVRFNQKNS